MLEGTNSCERIRLIKKHGSLQINKIALDRLIGITGFSDVNVN